MAKRKNDENFDTDPFDSQVESPSDRPSKQPGKYRSLTLGEQKQILDYFDKGHPLNWIVKKTGVPRSTIQSVKKRQDKIMKQFENGPLNVAELKKIPDDRHLVIEKELFDWYVKQEKGTTLVSFNEIRKKGMELHVQNCKIRTCNFSCSKTWVGNFKRRYNLRPRSTNGGDLASGTNNVQNLKTNESYEENNDVTGTDSDAFSSLEDAPLLVKLHSKNQEIKKLNRFLTFEQKQLDSLDENNSIRSVTEMTRVPKSTIGSIKNRRDKIDVSFENSTKSGEIKIIRDGGHTFLEKDLLDWYSEQQKETPQIPLSLIRKRGMEIHVQTCPDRECNFKCSRGWVENFKRKHHLCESGDISSSDINMIEIVLNEMMDDYEDENELELELKSENTSSTEDAESSDDDSLTSDRRPFTKQEPTKKYRHLTLLEQKHILEYLEDGNSLNWVQNLTGVPRTTIHSIKNRRDKILAQFENGTKNVESMKKIPSLTHLLIEEELYDWYLKRQKRTSHIPLSKIRKKGMEIHVQKCTIPECSFKCSAGYVQKFKKRYNIGTQQGVPKSELGILESFDVLIKYFTGSKEAKMVELLQVKKQKFITNQNV